MPLRRPVSTVRASLLTAIALLLAACAAPPSLPANVKTVKAPNSAPTMDSVDFSVAGMPSGGFSKLKLCVAENVSLPDVQLRDAAGSFVGAASRTYYQADNRQTVAGGSVFKAIDESSSSLVASGLVRASPAMGGLVNDVIRFDLRATSKPTEVSLVFIDITRAMQNTGSAANDGFIPVVIAPGSRSEAVYGALEQTASKLKDCLQRR